MMPASGEGAKTRVSANGGSTPFWSRSGDELYFFDGQLLMAARADAGIGGRLRIGRPEPLFQPTRTVYNDGLATFDVTKDGRFILFEFVDDQLNALDDFVFTRHWADELERRLTPQ